MSATFLLVIGTGWDRWAGSSPPGGPIRTVVPALALGLLVGLLLVLIFLVASLVLVRSARRRRAALSRRRPAPTPADDVWAMHKLPDEQENGEAGLDEHEH